VSSFTKVSVITYLWFARKWKCICRCILLKLHCSCVISITLKCGYLQQEGRWVELLFSQAPVGDNKICIRLLIVRRMIMQPRKRNSRRDGVAKLYNVQRHGVAHERWCANTFYVKGALTSCGSKSAFDGVTK